MGNSNYNGDVGKRTREAEREYFTYHGHASAEEAKLNVERHVHEDLNPKGSQRECCESEEHPDVCPIVVAFDVTRSRGDDAKVVFGKLPMFIGQIIMKDYVNHPEISFCAIGDVTCDMAPLQVGQFESDNRLDDILGKTWLEEGGGGTGQESYEYAAYYYARKVMLDCNKRGKKGYFFFTGDEGFYPKLRKEDVERITGDKLEGDLDSKKIFAELKKKFHVFFIYPKATWEQRKEDIDAEIKKLGA